MKSINPTTNQLIKEYKEHTDSEVTRIIADVNKAFLDWKNTPFGERSRLMYNTAAELRKNKAEYAELMTLEMGKLIRESAAEIDKCAWVCDYFAQNAETFLNDEVIASDATRSLVAFEPLGVILAVMPWNFPFWQVFRFASPGLMAGNTAILKHASNVPGCAAAIEGVFKRAGFPENVFRTLLIPSSKVERVVRNKYVRAVTLTGSEEAGRQVASIAGDELKKTVLELGGSDPFIVLEDADLEQCSKTAVTARMINTGQSCIAAKRFIVVKSVLQKFEEIQIQIIGSLKIGDPRGEDSQVGPLARRDLVDDLDAQVRQSVEKGAKLLWGGKRIEGPGFFYEPTVLTNVSRRMPVYEQETFGPVLAIIPVENEEEAIKIANDSEFGLGASIWTRNLEKAEQLARRIQTGSVFINAIVKSDPRLPFGGIKKSGYGRELGHYGIKEFVNIKTIWIA